MEDSYISVIERLFEAAGGVQLWWFLLSLISIINIALWACSYRLLRRRRHAMPSPLYNDRLVINWLSFVYVMVCAFRSFMPRIDLERIVLVDHWLSSVFIGRSLTTIAEFFFILQCSLLLRDAGLSTGRPLVVKISSTMVALVILAEAFSWYAALTTNYLGSVIEESLWTIAGILLITGFVLLWPRANDNERKFLGGVMFFAVGFVMFMVFVDVPMYWQRYIQDSATAVSYLGIREGVIDASLNYVVDARWQVWRQEIPWMTLYFTTAVWVSIWLVHAPIIGDGTNIPASGKLASSNDQEAA